MRAQEDMDLSEYWRRMVRGEGGTYLALLRTLLVPAAAFYGAAAWLYRMSYDCGLRARTQPALPTLSVGSLVLGGAGKTTVTAHLAQRLVGAGQNPAIVLRGYRGRAEGTLVASEGGKLLVGPEVAGDEAVLLTKLCPGATVVVGKRREDAIGVAARLGATCALLDDGFQYFRMRRDVDLILVNALQCGTSMRMFPAGILREPLSFLSRAHQVWITYSQAVSAAELEALCSWVRRWAPRAALVVTSHRIGCCRRLSDGTPVDIQGRRLAAFCGIGSPEGFQASLEALGVAGVNLRVFPDHHRFTPADLRGVAEWAQSEGADCVVTTAKDAVRIGAKDWPAAAPPLIVAEVELQVEAGIEHVKEAVALLSQPVARQQQ